MSAASEIFEVARRDFRQRARSKAFLFTTLLTVGLILVMAPVLGQVIAETEQENVGLVGDVSEAFVEQMLEEGDRMELSVETRHFDDRQAAETALRRDEVAVLVVGGEELVWRETPDLRLQTVLRAARQAVAQAEAIEELGLTEGEARRLTDPPGWESISLEPPDPEALPRMVVAQLGGFVLYMSIIIFGQFILMGVMEEKQNRVVEVILSRLPPTRLLAGKILGIGLLGLVQLVAFGGAIWAASNMIELPDVDLSGVGMGVFGQVVLWYLLGFGLYAVLYGAMGATVSRQEDAQGAVLLPTMVLVGAYLIATLSTDNPNGLASVAGSLLPLTAPVVMPFRAAAGGVPVWQILLSAALVVGTTLGMIRLGARVYSGAVLSLGKKVRLRDAWRASRVQAG